MDGWPIKRPSLSHRWRFAVCDLSPFVIVALSPVCGPLDVKSLPCTKTLSERQSFHEVDVK